MANNDSTIVISRLESADDAKEKYIQDTWEWLNQRGFQIPLEDVRGLCARNLSWGVKKSYVVVVSREPNYTTIRHIVETSGVYNEKDLKKWYYDQYHRLDSDEFVYCQTHLHMLAFVKTIEKEKEKKSKEEP